VKLRTERLVQIGVGLPTTTPGAGGELVLEWARRADAGPFSSLAVLDRIVYDSFEPFAALAASAGATERVRLATMIAVGPLRSTALLAKQAASVHRLSGGRLTLGLAVGARTEDYDAAGVEHRGRGRKLTEQLAYLRGDVDGDRVGPARDGIEVLVGGGSGQAFARMARYADGYAHGGGPPRAFASAVARAEAAWTDLGRPGRPKLWGQGYFALGDVERGNDYLRDYYAFTGPFAERIVAANLTSGRAIKDFVRGYEEAGCDELVLFPTVSDLHELEALQEALA
jgi:alkanesulfonate monooxygenase SsuD/methylene tetrahydromethanopterin reductase-like flavin-dependent oxidoreductase (luciferase family)